MTTVTFIDVGLIKTSGTTLTFVAEANPPIGSFIIAVAAWDNSSTGTTTPLPTAVSLMDNSGLGGLGNTWTKRGERGSGSAAGAGIVSAVWTCKTTELISGHTFTLTLSAAVSAKTIVLYQVTPSVGVTELEFNTAIAVVGAHAVSATPTVSITPSAAGQVVIATTAREGLFADAWTADADTVNGTWVNASGSGTSGGQGPTNASVRVYYKDVTAAGAQTHNASTTSTDWVSFALVLRPVVFAPPAPLTVKVWNGSAWVVKPLKRWNGSAWVAATFKRWNGTGWV